MRPTELAQWEKSKRKPSWQPQTRFRHKIKTFAKAQLSRLKRFDRWPWEARHRRCWCSRRLHRYQRFSRSQLLTHRALPSQHERHFGLQPIQKEDFESFGRKHETKRHPSIFRKSTWCDRVAAEAAKGTDKTNIAREITRTRSREEAIWHQSPQIIAIAR